MYCAKRLAPAAAGGPCQLHERPVIARRLRRPARRLERAIGQHGGQHALGRAGLHGEPGHVHAVHMADTFRLHGRVIRRHESFVERRQRAVRVPPASQENHFQP